MIKKKLINSDLDNGTDEYYQHAVTIVADCRTNGEVVELLQEVWSDGREIGNKELETFQPDDLFDGKNDYILSDSRVSFIHHKSFPVTGYKTIVPKLIAEKMLGLKKDVDRQRILWSVEKDGLLYKIVVKRNLKTKVRQRN